MRRNNLVGACRKTWTDWSQKSRGDLIKAWVRAAAGTTRRGGRETLYEDKVDVGKEGEG